MYTNTPVVTFVGASGGVGTSCLLAAVAAAAVASGRRVACVDADPGGGLDVVLGMDHLPGVRWPALAGAHGEIPPAMLLSELPQAAGVYLLSHARERLFTPPEQAHDAVVGSLAGGTDLVLVDAGRARPAPTEPRVGGFGADTSPGELDPRLWRGADHAVLVVGATPQSLAAATAVVGALPENGPCWWLAQRATKGAGHLPETVQSALGLHLAAAVPDDPKVDRCLVDGVAPGQRGPLNKAAESLLTLLTDARSAAA